MIIHGTLKKKYIDALEYFAELLFTPQMNRNIRVRVVFRKNLDAVNGWVNVDGYSKSGKPRSFVIEINKNDSEEEIINTLAHEMVHMKQYAYGQLNESMTLWRGREVDSDKIDYYDQPWEIEAMVLADMMYGFYALGLKGEK